MLPEEKEMCSSLSSMFCSVGQRQGYLQREKNPWIFPRAGGKPCNLLSDKILISKTDLELKAMFVFVQGNKGERDQQLIVCSQCRISGTLEAPWITQHSCRAGLTLVCCKSGVPALTHFSPWKGEGLGSTHSFLGKQKIHGIKTVRKGEVRVKQSKRTMVCAALGLDVTSVCRRLFVSGPVLIYLFMRFILNVFQRKLEKKKRIILLNLGKEQWSQCLPAVLEEMKCHSQQNSFCLHRCFEKFCATWDKSNIKAAWSSWDQGVSSNLWNPLFSQENNYCNYCTENVRSEFTAVLRL